MLESFYNVVSLLCALQGVLLSCIFFIKKSNHTASRVLGIYIFIFSLGMLENYFKANLTGMPGQIIYSFMGFSNFLYGPLLYLFVHFLTVKKPDFKTKYLLHLLPFAILLMLDFGFILVSKQGIREGSDILELVLFETLVIQILYYNVLAIRKLKKYGKAILQIHPNLDSRDLKWLQVLVIFLTAIYILSFAITHAIVFGFKTAEHLYLLVQLLITAVIYIISYRMLLQPQLFILQSQPNNNGPANAVILLANTQEKYRRSGLKPAQAEQHLKTLLTFMETEKPYRDPELTIHTLSEALDISRNHLTEIINEKLEKNFFEFVNTYRIEEVKKLLIDSSLSHLNLYGLGLKAGFKSKTAFNTNFKKITGITPSEWKQQYYPSTQPTKPELKEVLT